MRKITSLVLALVLAMSFCTTAFAVGKGDRNIDVQAKYQDSTTTAEVYSVDVQWGAMKFTYTETGAMVWNPEDHSYTDNTQAGWTAEGNTVTVVNHSNAPVNIAFSFQALKDFGKLNGSFDVTARTLQAGVVGGFDTADQVVSTLTLDGSIGKTLAEYTKVGTVTVTIG